MSRKLRIEYSGAMYHVMSRGDQREDIFRDDRWSSYGEYLKPPGQRPGWLRVDRLLGEKGIPKDSEAGRRQFGLQMERRRAEESGADDEQIRRDWVLGSGPSGRSCWRRRSSGSVQATTGQSVRRLACRKPSESCREKSSGWAGMRTNCGHAARAAGRRSCWRAASARKPA